MKENLKQKLIDGCSALATWLGAWCKDNIDFALILAVCTETPRWTVTFLAIHEPLWIGISLGVLLAFATSKVWRHYFATRSWITLTFNVLAIILAVAVISPVLYAMIEHKPDQVDIAKVLQDATLRWAWSFGLALTTFVPLVQLAAVHGAQSIAATPLRKPVQDQQEDARVAKPDIADRVAQLQGEGLEQPDLIDQLLGESYSGNAIAKALGVNASTVSRRRNAAKRNGHDIAEVQS